MTLDLVVTFVFRAFTQNNADAGFRVTINDGETRAAIAAAIVLIGERRIALVGRGAAFDPATYPVSVAQNWVVQPVTLRLRRFADGSAGLIELNGVNPGLFLPADLVAVRTRAGTTVEFGAFSVEGLADVEVTQFYTERVSEPVPEPASLLLLGSGLVGLAATRIRKLRRKA